MGMWLVVEISDEIQVACTSSFFPASLESESTAGALCISTDVEHSCMEVSYFVSAMGHMTLSSRAVGSRFDESRCDDAAASHTCTCAGGFSDSNNCMIAVGTVVSLSVCR